MRWHYESAVWYRVTITNMATGSLTSYIVGGDWMAVANSSKGGILYSRQ